MFARAHFGPKPNLGAPKAWTAEKYCQLLYDIAQVQSRHSRLSDTAACIAVLKKKSYGRGKKPITAERLRRALREARDPRRNTIIAFWVAKKLQEQQMNCSVAGKEWTPQLARQHEIQFVELIIEWIEDNWPRMPAT